MDIPDLLVKLTITILAPSIIGKVGPSAGSNVWFVVRLYLCVNTPFHVRHDSTAPCRIVSSAGPEGSLACSGGLCEEVQDTPLSPLDDSPGSSHLADVERVGGGGGRVRFKWVGVVAVLITSWCAVVCSH